MLFAMLLLCAVLSACVTVPNIPLYGDKGTLGARKEYLLGGPGANINKQTWDKMRFGMVCTPVPEFSKLMAVIEKLCYQQGKCNYEEVAETAQRLYEQLYAKRQSQ